MFWVRVTRSLVLYVCFVDHCLPFCAFSFLAILFSVLRYTDSDYPHGIFKLFFDIYVLLILPSFHTGSHASSRCCCFWRNRMSRDITNQWGFSRKQNGRGNIFSYLTAVDQYVVFNFFFQTVNIEINTWPFLYQPGYHPETPISARDAVEDLYGSRDDSRDDVEKVMF